MATADDQATDAAHRIWYAGYGSNLRAARMATYLQGGIAPGSHRANAGTRDGVPAAEVRTCEVPGRLRFEGRFEVWGDGGGAAFFERSAAPGERVVCRAYLVTVSQVVDVVLQENGHDPRAADPAVLAELESRIARPPAHGDATIDLSAHRLGPYDLVEWLPAMAPPDDAPLQVALLGRSTPLAETAPPAAYHDVIRRGLIEDARLPPAAADRYLARFLPGPGSPDGE